MKAPSPPQRPNPFHPSLCGRFIVETGDLFANVMTVAWAIDRQCRAEIQGADYEREADLMVREGREVEASIVRDMARQDLTIAADLLEALGKLTEQERRAA